MIQRNKTKTLSHSHSFKKTWKTIKNIKLKHLLIPKSLQTILTYPPSLTHESSDRAKHGHVLRQAGCSLDLQQCSSCFYTMRTQLLVFDWAFFIDWHLRTKPRYVDSVYKYLYTASIWKLLIWVLGFFRQEESSHQMLSSPTLIYPGASIVFNFHNFFTPQNLPSSWSVMRDPKYSCIHLGSCIESTIPG